MCSLNEVNSSPAMEVNLASKTSPEIISCNSFLEVASTALTAEEYKKLPVSPQKKIPQRSVVYLDSTAKGHTDSRQPVQKKVPTRNRCYMCQKNLETVNHLFLHCAVDADSWHMFLLVFDLSWALHLTIKKAVDSWNSWRISEAIKKMWKKSQSCNFGVFGQKGIEDVLMVF